MAAGTAAVVVLIAATSWLLARQSPGDHEQKNRAVPSSGKTESRRAEPSATSTDSSHKQRPSADDEVTPDPSENPKSPTAAPDKSQVGSGSASPQKSLVRVGRFTGYACPYGRMCLFEGWDGTGWMGYAPGCGTTDLASLRHMVSSVRTHGNAVTLYDDSGKQAGHVDGWTRTNLSAEETDQAVTAYVHC